MQSILFPFVLILTLIAANIELDIYVPAFPQMLHYFSTNTDQLQWIVSVNFIGVAIGCLFVGPLSDHFGRKRIIIMGLIIFVIGSAGCVFSHTLNELIFWRFIQGLGSCAPATVGFAAIVETFEERKAAQFISIANSVITGSMAAAPIIGNYLTLYFNWRANFIFILILAIISLIAMQIIFKEPQKNLLKANLNLKDIFENYQILLRNSRFMFLGTIPCLIYASLMVYIANLSLLFVNHLNVSQQYIGYYQAAIMFTFLIFSFIAALLLSRITPEKSQKIGLLIVSIASLLLLLVALIAALPLFITLVMMLFSAGSAIVLGPFISQALNIYPHMRGTSSALLGTLRLTLSSIVIAIAGHLFNGTVLPIAGLIFIMMLICLIMYFFITKKSLHFEMWKSFKKT